MLISVIVSGRRPALVRRIEIGLSLILCVVIAWTVLDGPALITTAGDRMFKSCLLLIIVFTLVDLG